MDSETYIIGMVCWIVFLLEWVAIFSLELWEARQQRLQRERYARALEEFRRGIQ